MICDLFTMFAIFGIIGLYIFAPMMIIMVAFFGAATWYFGVPWDGLPPPTRAEVIGFAFPFVASVGWWIFKIVY